MRFAAVQRLAGQHGLQSIVVGRVVAAGDHDAAPGLEVLRREVQDRGRHPPDVDDVPAALAQPLDEGREQFGTGVPPVSTHDHRLHASMVRLGTNRTADPPDDFRREGIADDASDVVGTENPRGKTGGLLDRHASSPPGAESALSAPAHS